jgi:signal transduction histidine kinase/CheY-like chemotaxis protein
MTLLFAVNSIFLKRINNFRNAINKLATGDLTIRLPTEINDEIGDAAYDFNAMAAITEHQKQNLEEIVSSRTRELTMANERLMLSRDEALSASHTKSEFLSTMSHEIRTPLNGVIGMLSLLRTLDTDPERLDYLETAYNSGHVLLTLLNDILDISKIEANKIQLEQVNFDLKHTVNGIITLLGEDAQRKSLDLSFHIPSDYPSPIKGDPTRLRQILTNLISNSIKFTESGFVDLTINTIKLHKYFVLFEFKITDSGIGINEENQSKVFGKFAQSDNSITRKYGGSGLGLAIVKELVAKMGGSIKLTSELGKGSVFAFTLPFNIPAEETIKPVVNKSKTIKIIISSDYNDEAQSYLKEFESHGWEVDLLGTDEDPLPLMLEAENNNHPYHIAILEKKNSQAASIALASLIRKNQNLDNLKIITVNEIGQRGDGQIARLSGMSGYLVKPIPPSLLSKCVIDVINTPLQSTSELITRHSIVEKEQLEIKQNSTNNQTKKKTILLVEDNPVNQKIAQAMLGKLGHDVIVAENGQIAVEAAANGSFDLILMDCQMPVMDGYEATKTIRQNEQATNSRIPIVAMTANAYPEDIEKCMASGMDGHLTKPVDMSTLNKTVESYLYSANTDGLKSLSQG